MRVRPLWRRFRRTKSFRFLFGFLFLFNWTIGCSCFSDASQVTIGVLRSKWNFHLWILRPAEQPHFVCGALLLYYGARWGHEFHVVSGRVAKQRKWHPHFGVVARWRSLKPRCCLRSTVNVPKESKRCLFGNIWPQMYERVHPLSFGLFRLFRIFPKSDDSFILFTL